MELVRKQMKQLFSFYFNYFVPPGERPDPAAHAWLREPNVQKGFVQLFHQAVEGLQRYQPDVDGLMQEGQKNAWSGARSPQSGLFKLFLQTGQQMDLWIGCIQILHITQFCPPCLRHDHPPRPPSEAVRLICHLLCEFVAPSFRRSLLDSKRGSLLPPTESPLTAVLCTGVKSMELARGLHIELMFLAAHWESCSLNVQDQLACQILVDLPIIWELALRMVERLGPEQEQQHQKQQQQESVAQKLNEPQSLQERWQLVLDAAAWTAYVILSRRKFGVSIPQDLNMILEVALATMQRTYHAPTCGPRFPPGVAAALVAVSALLENKRSSKPALHVMALASGLRFQLNRCIAGIYAVLGTAATPATATSGPASAPAFSVPLISKTSPVAQEASSSLPSTLPAMSSKFGPPAAAATHHPAPPATAFKPLLHQAAEILASTCNFYPNFGMAGPCVQGLRTPQGPQRDSAAKNKAKAVLSYIEVNRAMLAEPMLELMLMLDAEPVALRAHVNALGLLLAQVKAQLSMVKFLTIGPRGALTPAVSAYCQAISALAFHSDPLRLAMRAISSCQHQLAPDAEPISQRLAPRLVVASEVLQLFTELYLNVQRQALMEHKSFVTSALWTEARGFVMDFISVTAPRETPAQQKQQPQSNEQEQGLDAYLRAAATAWSTTSSIFSFFFFSLLQHGDINDPFGLMDTDIFKRTVDNLALEPGAAGCLRTMDFAISSSNLLSTFSPALLEGVQAVKEVFEETGVMRSEQVSSSTGGSAFTSISELLDLMVCPFEKACSQQVQIWASIVKKGEPSATGPPQRSKAQRMGLLLNALQSSMPTTIHHLAFEEETVFDPIRCCNLDCKGSKQPGIKWCPHCLGMVWCLDCVSSPSYRVHCSKCSQRRA